MRCFHSLPALLLFLLAATGLSAEPKEYQLKLSLDPLLDLSKTWALTADGIEATFRDEGFKENPFVQWSDDKGIALFSHQPFSNISVDLTMLDGAAVIEQAQVVVDKNDLTVSKFLLSMTDVSSEVLARVRSKVSALIGGDARPGPRPALGWKSDAGQKSEAWTGNAGTAVLQSNEGRARLFFGRPGTSVTGLTEGIGSMLPRTRGAKLEFFVRLDQLLPVPELWTLSPDALDARVSVNLGLKENPFFKWNTTARDSARFSKDLFNNTKTDVWLFNDTINAEEVNIDFTNGRATKLVITLLSRGNSGKGITSQLFDLVYKTTGRELSTMLGVRPTHSTPSGKTLVKTDGYLWTSPHTLALLEFNADAPKGQVEFLRLTMTPAAERAKLLNLAGIGNNATTRSKDSLARSVKRDKNTGDVEITGVPMRDQGQKGYCVAASCERLFRYLGQPCDMDELAQLVSADARMGASPSVMYGSLAKIDQRYNMRVKLQLIPPHYGLGSALKSRTELERAQHASLRKIIPEAIDQGLPLLWCVALSPGETGVSPQPGEARPVSRAVDGPRVGHMRLIIGYNSRTGGVIYTDSWGAGHERKVMSLAEALEMTTAVFSMTPSR